MPPNLDRLVFTLYGNFDFNTSSLDELNPEDSFTYLTDAIRLGANPIVLYCWWPHFLGYGIKGLPLIK